VKFGSTSRAKSSLLWLKAWEFDVPLRVVALRGSVPGAWPSDFKAVSGKHARLAYEQRAQLTDIYSELTVGRCGACLCACIASEKRDLAAARGVSTSSNARTACDMAMVRGNSAAGRRRSQQLWQMQ
jgi:hypothetical protein